MEDSQGWKKLTAKGLTSSSAKGLMSQLLMPNTEIQTLRERSISKLREKKEKKIDGHEMEGNENGFRKMMEDILILCDCDIVCLLAC